MYKTMGAHLNMVFIAAVHLIRDQQSVEALFFFSLICFHNHAYINTKYLVPHPLSINIRNTHKREKDLRKTKKTIQLPTISTLLLGKQHPLHKRDIFDEQSGWACLLKKKKGIRISPLSPSIWLHGMYRMNENFQRF